MNVGYIRVSTVEQNTNRQDDRLAFCDKIFSEKKSGKNTDRPQLKAMLKFIGEGDTVWVTELSRLARSMVDLHDIAEEIMKKGAELKSIKENIDLNSATGVFTFHILSAMAEFERSLIKERQAEGIKAAKERGQTWGAKKKYCLDDREFHELMQSYFNKKMSLDEAVNKFGGAKPTFYLRYRKWKEDNGIE